MDRVTLGNTSVDLVTLLRIIGQLGLCKYDSAANLILPVVKRPPPLHSRGF
jgi:hypothetical protein